VNKDKVMIGEESCKEVRKMVAMWWL